MEGTRKQSVSMLAGIATRCKGPQSLHLPERVALPIFWEVDARLRAGWTAHAELTRLNWRLSVNTSGSHVHYKHSVLTNSNAQLIVDVLFQ